MMRRTSSIAVSIAVACLALGVVAATKKPPKRKITIKGCQKKKKPVLFDHPKHVKWMKRAKLPCASCHHLVKGKPAAKARCSSCHLQKRGKMRSCAVSSRTKNPFHKQCIGCHKKVAKSAKKLPVKCKQCHVK